MVCIMWITLPLRSFAFISFFFLFESSCHLNIFGCIWNHLSHLLSISCPLGIKKSSIWFQCSSDMWQNKQYWMCSRPTSHLMPSLLQQMANVCSFYECQNGAASCIIGLLQLVVIWLEELLPKADDIMV